MPVSETENASTSVARLRSSLSLLHPPDASGNGGSDQVERFSDLLIGGPPILPQLFDDLSIRFVEHESLTHTRTQPLSAAGLASKGAAGRIESA